MKIVIRPFNPETDSGLIYDSYPKGVYHASCLRIVESKTDWMNEFYETVKKQLLAATIRVACIEDDPNKILGYSIIDGDMLEFVYVKEMFRNNGIGTLLTKDKFRTINPFTLTKVGDEILKRRERNKTQGETIEERANRETN